ncbi:RNA methyltransferase [Flammeovirga yaeyamensis]|uniref:tRNA (guanosine(18)-2'-O)-methyltransferase n=1 Tax=Flammeovirga yaeyamensis TaxID=367791 RepID=A0AAX1N7A7_9BACT|nr:RNA methyltransferase [Flammeovirga yaeyamensis]MBB3699782.1 tRNA (guanosine-2'-O-)-methyltransferase [Flammeovirga yaeyamensis]NMF36649.1 RNA methyltransferase [Flammeovirga yaeyamensis]QWG02306.1 RNA methyltransferase [Flammeovirga yaeyamensis]
MPYVDESYVKFYNTEYFKQYTEVEGLIDYLKTFATEERLEKIQEVLQGRTNHLTVLLEEIYKPQNGAAVMRTCDCFGIQQLHVIDAEDRFQLSTSVAKGAAKWVDLHKYSSLKSSVEHLKSKGYKLVATSPHTDMTLDDLPVDEPLALMFGNEFAGLTDEAVEMADYKVKIPMHGFAESFNISVSAALVLNQLSIKMRKSPDIDWTLRDDEKKLIEGAWVCKSLKFFENLLKTYPPKK